MVYEARVGKVWVSLGIMKAFGIGLSISRYGFTFELLCFYGGVEW